MVDEVPVRVIGASDASEAEAAVWEVLRSVPDPEIPVLNVVDLGIVRYVRMPGPEVGITPTYSGCPATEVIERSIVSALKKNGFVSVKLRRVLSPPWTLFSRNWSAGLRRLMTPIFPPSVLSK